MKKLAAALALSLGYAAFGPVTAQAQNAKPAYWEGTRTAGNLTMFNNSGSGVNIQSAGQSSAALGQLTINWPSTYASGVPDPTTNWIWMNRGSLVGTCTDTLVNPNACTEGTIQLANDQLNAINNRGPFLLTLNHTYGGGAASGNFGGLFVNLTQVGTNNRVGSNDVAILDKMYANANSGGTLGSESGAIFGLNVDSEMGPGGTNYNAVIGEEIDIAIQTGGSALDKIAMQIVDVSTDTVQAGRDSAGIMFGSQVNTNGASPLPGWNYGISFGGYAGWQPIAPTGTLIGTYCHANNCVGAPLGTVAHGIDFTNYTFSSDAFKSPGFKVDGSGNITAPKLAAPTNSNLQLGSVTDGTGVQVVDDGGPSVNLINLQPGVAGDPDFIWFGGPSSDANTSLNLSVKGTGNYSFYTGGSLFGATNRQFLIGAVAGAVDYLQIFGSTTGNPGLPSINAGGSDANIDIQLVPKGSGQLRLAGGSQFSANGSVATVLGSLGPVGSHTTVQKWLVVRDAAGNLLYIPAF